MNKSFNKDFTPVIERILALTDMIHEMRRGFAFTKDDAYSKKRQLFIEQALARVRKTTKRRSEK